MVGHVIAGEDYSMRQPHQVIRHARAALRQAAASIAQFRARLALEQADEELEYRAIGKAWLRDLERMHADLSERFFELIRHPDEELAEHCKAFFSSYDAFLEEVRRARVELARELLPTQTDQAGGDAGKATTSRQEGRMRPGSRVSSEEAAVIGQLRRQMHWMADDVLSSMLGVSVEVASNSRQAKVASIGPPGTGAPGAGSAVGLHRRLRSALDRRIVAKRAATSRAWV
jgi:hypothetical protein